MIFRIVLTAVIAGLVCGLLATGLQAWRTTPLILEAETYERAAPQAAAGGHAEATSPHGAEGWAPDDGIERTMFTLLANILAATAFAAFLASGFTLSGTPVTPVHAIAWGAGGFAAFSFLPALGLPPELPGMVAGDLAARQFWWWSSVLANCVGLAALCLAPRPVWKALGGLLVLAPLAVGAPHPDAAAGAGTVPPELAARFAIETLGVALVFWIALGLSSTFVFARLGSRRGAGDAELSADHLG